MKLEQQEYESQKRAVLVDQTNLQEFYRYITGIPLNERKTYIGSDDHIEHSKGIELELTELKQPSDIQGAPARLLRIPKSQGSSTRIRNEVAEAFGLTAVQVKNYLQIYRKFLRDND